MPLQFFACVLRAATEGRCVKRKMFLAFGFSFFPLKLKIFRLSGKICLKNGKNSKKLPFTWYFIYIYLIKPLSKAV